MNTERCKSCGRLVVFRRHYITGKNSPITAEPIRGGNIWIRQDGTYEIVPPGDHLGRGDLHLNHFADCPGAPNHRTRKQETGQTVLEGMEGDDGDR